MKAVIFAAVLSAAFLCEQTNAQLAPPPPPTARGFRPGSIGLGAEDGLRPVTTIQGKVAMLTTNDDYVYDGFVILNGTDSVWVKFPPHKGKQVTNVVKTGSTVSVSGSARTNPEGRQDLRFISITAGGQTITDTPPAASPTPVAETNISGSGKITSTQTDRDGRLKGFILDGHTILRMPPHAAEQLAGMVKAGETVSYTGHKKPVSDGEVIAGNYSIVHTQTITVNGQQYLAQ